MIQVITPTQTTYSIGIDEVGRGPIAGPVAVGAFVFLKPSARRLFRGVKESKQLTEVQREAWFAQIQQAKKEGHVDFCVTFKSEKIIDTKGLTYAIRTALNESLENIVSLYSIAPDRAEIVLDGGLKAPVHFKNQKTIIKGDEKKAVIALASICAKVLRDRVMNEFAKVHVNYGFETHKGYATRAHVLALKKHGMLPIHRKSFLKSIQDIYL